MIRAVTGRTGEGKTCYAVRCLVLDTLLSSKRVVVTNISLKLRPLAKYIESRGGVFDRRQLIMLPSEPNDSDKKQYVVVYRKFEKYHTEIDILLFDVLKFWEVTPKKSLILIDEAGEYFNALQLKRDDSAVLGSYARLHRHLQQDLYLMVQTFEHMAKQLRDLVHEQIVIYSLYQHPPPPLFIKINAFMIRHYDYGGTANPKAHELYFRAYKTAYFDLYDSFQHSNYHKSIDAVVIDEKKTVKKSSFSKIKEKITGNPMFAVYAIAGVCIFFGISRLSTFFNTPEQTQIIKEPARPKLQLQTAPKNEKNTNHLVPNSIDRGSEQRALARARTQTFKAVKPRKYGIPTDQGANDTK